MANNEEILSKGKRKNAVAQVRLRPGTGKYIINRREVKDYFPSEAVRGFIDQPLIATENQGKFDIVANVKGGGMMGQAGALRHGIARALSEYNEELRPILKNSKMLRRDSRVKERKKTGQPKARKKFQFSKR